MPRITPHLRLLQLRVLALQSVRTGYEPHQVSIRSLGQLSANRLRYREDRINWLVRHYRAQISPELVPPMVDNG